MKYTIIQLSLVVVGEVHNPTILNPDFLALRGIVPKEWGWEVEETTTMPPLAYVRYRNGFVVSVEHAKLQVVAAGLEDPGLGKSVEVAVNYVKTLPHVRYTAVGANFQATVDIPQPTTFLKRRFLSAAAEQPKRPLEAVGLRFVYALPGGRIGLSLDAGEVPQGDKSVAGRRDVLVVNGNFHRDCTSYPADPEAIAHLAKAAGDLTTFDQLIDEVVGKEP